MAKKKAGMSPPKKARHIKRRVGSSRLTDYTAQGPGKFVVMRVKKLNGWYDAMALSDLLNKATPVTYDSKTALHEFYWPTAQEIGRAKPDEVNACINAAVNEFMKRCDSIEFRDKSTVSGITVGAQRIERPAPDVTVTRAVR